MANIKKITLPSGTTYDIVDQGARDLIEELSSYTQFLGVTTTALVDGSTTNPVTIGGESVTAKKGDIVTYGSAEFIFNGTAWQAFGDLSGLGSLAYKNSASGTFTPAGTITQPTFSGIAATISASYTPAGTVTKPTFAGTQATISAAFTPAGTVTISKGSGTANYTPSGSVSVDAPSVTLKTSSITPMGSVGSLPSCTLPVLTTTVANETLTLSWTSGAWDAGALPTVGTAVTVATGVSSVTAGSASFTGTGVELKASFTGTSGNATATYTPSGTVTQPTFEGTEANISASYTPAGTVTKPTFSGTAGTVEVS